MQGSLTVHDVLCQRPLCVLPLPSMRSAKHLPHAAQLPTTLHDAHATEGTACEQSK